MSSKMIAKTFPRFKERLDQVAATISGGEQQMLVIARALVPKPKMVSRRAFREDHFGAGR
ncbi:hypothetical protein [Variovorax sp. GB1P17]|uniref:hypothetical protein n=1 Tax=Variovorax sp. GB1P17 TaxID=3443740 RepID=UPI003F497BB8